MGFKRVTTEYYEQLRVHYFDNLTEVDHCPEGTICQSSRKKRQTLRIGLSLLKNQYLITFKNRKHQLNGFPGEFYWTFKGEIIPILYSLFQKIEAEGVLPNSFYVASITLMPRPDKDIISKENCSPISLVNIHAKILKKTLSNRT